ncbi:MULTISPECIES: aminopeptidase P family protein [unclassified Commensalibacter]|uniref:aminopeptidase P family protein n=1 Tax=unclassified Commensalibacter TaxID=2630218 RepID=UPI0018DC20F6|nr:MULTISPECIES: aminopeptidase P family protein [unclassified Commensalibacter]MBH9969568.1 aminopeptidase P family protein [Commensalibacter sp. M0265]MBH9976923.1 aminopeptidase P family protein [Commensalibacter sp. M0266]MBH9992140.1 aminopeptidase P family protein [Commensalibacter sp. M0270]MBI0046099.1 aminopeptidase P family protein [Commensalibacter sp. M0267]MBI0055768.1 aminopeptidase P family protein [Commensalibacter sp. M0268]
MQHTEKLSSLRSILKKDHLDGFIINRGDEFLNEYVAPYAERLAWLTGFTGSAGMAIVLPDNAAVFSDGRYILQMQQQLDQELWEYHHISHKSPLAWILDHNHLQKLKLGYDPRLMSQKNLESLQNNKIIFVPITDNPIDTIWLDQPGYPNQPIEPHPLEFSGLSHHNKIEKLQKELLFNNEDAFIFCDPASICWLLNIRGSDVPYSPIPLVYAILYRDHVCLYADQEQCSETLSDFLGHTVKLCSRNDIYADLRKIKSFVIGLDKNQTPIGFIQLLKKQEISIHYRTNPILLPKSCKNQVEQKGAINAHIRDGIAICRFLFWLEKHGIDKSETVVAEKLNQFRIETGGKFYKEESFPAISATGSNGAIIHYQATKTNHSIIRENQLYLIDSGGQYKDGTTDITRTIWMGKKFASSLIREQATMVLKGHIALSSAVFPIGTTGSQLDVLARYALWQNGLNYDHGTGHGVGSYLSVHEGPCRISSQPFPISLKEGMILSNEPGYYLAGHHGIRLENLLLVCKAPYDNFLKFKPLTLVPFDWKIINSTLLTPQEKNWLNNYHKQITDLIYPHLNKNEQTWLMKMCTFI